MKKVLLLLIIALGVLGGLFCIWNICCKPEGVQLWENGPYWAECNVGASSPEESGYYFWWGDTVGYKREGDSWNAVDGSRKGFSFSDENCPTHNKSISELQQLGYIDETGSLTPLYDAATVHLGAPWRMPTAVEFEALIENCDLTVVTQNGIEGALVTGRGTYASKSIFLPTVGLGHNTDLVFAGTNLGADADLKSLLLNMPTGCYWSSTPNSDDSDSADELSFCSDLDFFDRRHNGRNCGQSVRPVRGFAK